MADKKTLICRALLVAIGIAGFLLQFLITEGLQREKGGRATNLIVSIIPFHMLRHDSPSKEPRKDNVE